MFNERKVAQMAAFFLQQAGGTLNILKLMKLLYLSEREAMNRYGEPLSYDAMVSMPHGPVLSMTYECMNGYGSEDPEGWDGWVSDKENHAVSLRRENTAITDLDELSDADIEVLQSVWDSFGHMTKWQVRNYTHTYCSEWKDPNGSSYPIEYKDVFIALGKDQTIAKELQDNILANKQAARLFSSL